MRLHLLGTELQAPRTFFAVVKREIAQLAECQVLRAIEPSEESIEPRRDLDGISASANLLGPSPGDDQDCG